MSARRSPFFASRSVLASVFALCAALLVLACGGANTGVVSRTPTATHAGGTATVLSATATGGVSGGTPVAGGPTATPAPTLGQMTVYVGTDSGTFFGVNAGNGHQRWQATIAGAANKPFTSIVLVKATTQTGDVYALNVGNAIWHQQFSGGISGRPAMVNGTVYF